MHLQPVFAGRRALRSTGRSERLFATGLSLPSGSALGDDADRARRSGRALHPGGAAVTGVSDGATTSRQAWARRGGRAVGARAHVRRCSSSIAVASWSARARPAGPLPPAATRHATAMRLRAREVPHHAAPPTPRHVDGRRPPHRPVGRFLRSTSLDELPTLWNVLKGDMSLVGPAAAAVEYLAALLAPSRRAGTRCGPGVTGLAQVSGPQRASRGTRSSRSTWSTSTPRACASTWRSCSAPSGPCCGGRGSAVDGEATMSVFTGSQPQQVRDDVA